MKYPLQPIEKNEDGVLCFKANAIVKFLLEAGPFTMNQLQCMPFDNVTREQFAQLIGYSVNGFSELSYISNETYHELKI